MFIILFIHLFIHSFIYSFIHPIILMLPYAPYEDKFLSRLSLMEKQTSNHVQLITELRTELNNAKKKIKTHEESISDIRDPPFTYTYVCNVVCCCICLIPLYFFNAYIYMKIVELYQK
jgi:hypothetical protein